MAEEIVKLLKRARARIGDINSWCEDYFALDRDGNITGTRQLDAVRWCAIGVLTKEADSLEARQLAVKALDHASMILHGMKVVAANDRLGHDAVLRAYDAAIAQLEAGDDQ